MLFVCRVENMSLRLDDINQKENSVRLSMQTVDYRLAKLEDLVLQSLTGLEKLQESVSGLKVSNVVMLVTLLKFLEFSPNIH